MCPAPQTSPNVKDRTPLVVDLDGTLLRSDLLVESLFSAIGANPWSVFSLLKAWSESRAALKERAAALGAIDVSTLPYDPGVLAHIETARSDGRPVYLASASNESLVSAVAQHLGKFDGWFGSDRHRNLKAEAKASLLVEKFGDKGFDYAGNETADLVVWQRARKAIAVGAPASVMQKLARQNGEVTRIDGSQSRWTAWLKLLRVHQYAKNVLVFVPLITAHALSGGALSAGLLAFVAFSLCASGIYILNDAADLAADRAHPTKKDRPLANGSVPIMKALAAVPILFALAFATAALTTIEFIATLGIYLAVTIAYTFKLKRMMLLDAVSLAGLYSLRVIGGAKAAVVPISSWLLGFSLFIFTALALVKRYVELAKLQDLGLPDPANRAYQKGDLTVIASLAAAAGYNAVIVLALYISSDAVTPLYGRPEMLWLACPIVMYWISRLLLKAHRRQIDDDPVIFALKDPVSLIAAAAIALIGLLAL